MMDISKLIEALRLPTRTLAAVALAAAVLLFGEAYLPAALQLRAFGGVFRTATILIFVVSTCLVLVAVVAWTVRAGLAVLNGLGMRWWGRRRLHNLNPGEKATLALYIEKQTRSRALMLTSGVVAVLVSDGILSPGNEFAMGMSREYVINEWAWTYLNKHKHLVIAA